MSQQSGKRVERDSMGPMEVPAEAYYGASTMRAVLNFPISELRFPRSFIEALGLIKLSAATVNLELGLLERQHADAIVRAAGEVAEGRLDDQFVVDVFQTGSGTSTNMNANEVIANRAGEILGGSRGSRVVHPNDHVNLGQSSNDVIPTAMQLAALLGLERDLIPALESLREALEEKSREFWDVVKTGRTHLQDATPVRLGQEFQGYAGQAEAGVERLRRAGRELAQVPLGGTAVGTGINAHPDLARRVCRLLSERTGVTVEESGNHFAAQSTLDATVSTSGSLRAVATSLYKIANDITWMGTGPRAGLGELALPEVQPGSSIMPGKVNPVIPEALIQVVAQVIGNDATVAVAGQRGFFELNTMFPVAAYNVLQSISLLSSATRNFTERCVRGLAATERGPEIVEKGLMLATALAPVIGYDRAADVAKEAARSGSTIRQVAREKTDLSPEQLDQVLDPAAMTAPGLAGG